MCGRTTILLLNASCPSGGAGHPEHLLDLEEATRGLHI